MKERRFLMIVLVMAVLPTGNALAQATMPPPGREVSQEPKANLNAPPPNVGELLKRNNGSLYRAAAAMPDDPRIVRASEVSVFAVPPAKPRTLEKHDLITIVVREQSSFSSEGTTETSKDGSIDASIEQFPKLNLANFAIENAITNVQPRIAMSGEREFNGDGSIDRKDSFTARIQAEVVDVKPNGTLVVQARKRIVTDEEEQVFMLSGVCRVQDILPDNTVLSTQLYDLELRKTHSGVVKDATKRGWVPRALDWLNQF